MNRLQKDIYVVGFRMQNMVIIEKREGALPKDDYFVCKCNCGHEVVWTRKQTRDKNYRANNHCSYCSPTKGNFGKRAIELTRTHSLNPIDSMDYRQGFEFISRLKL